MKKTQLLMLLFILSVIASAVYFYPSLPSRIPMHWNIQGQIDSYWPKNKAIWFTPSLIVVMYALFRILPQFDPNKNKYRLFKTEWDIIQTGLIAFFTYLHFVILYASYNPSVNTASLLFIGIGSLFVLLGNYLSKIRQNYFIGIKVPWTLSDEDNWNKTHRYASWCFVGVGIITLIEAVFMWKAAPIIFGGFMLASLLPILYSFLLFKKKALLMKFVHIGLLTLVALLFLIRFISREDDWICRNGKWIPHGKPTSPPPITRCR